MTHGAEAGRRAFEKGVGFAKLCACNRHHIQLQTFGNPTEMSAIDTLLRQLWEQYSSINPQAAKIHALLSERGETVANDHIAFRTFDDPRVGIDQLAVPFLEAGYEFRGEYDFEAKKLYAQHFEHEDPALPRVFISQLLTDRFSESLQKAVADLIDQLTTPTAQPMCVAGQLWRVDFATYQQLQQESEYAAWMAAHGFCANHFTVSVNELQTVDSLEELNTLIIDAGFSLNDSGGAIKGTPEVFLEQSSTIASRVNIAFEDGTHEIPGCYYEFARRYPLPDGTLFSGFVAKSADKIFESTDERLQS